MPRPDKSRGGTAGRSEEGKPMPASANKLQITTVRIPRRLYEEARRAVEQGCTNASSLNELIVEALKNRLKQLRRAAIDAEFAEMRNDAQYRLESDVLAEQFASNDRDSLPSAVKVTQ